MSKPDRVPASLFRSSSGSNTPVNLSTRALIGEVSLVVDTDSRRDCKGDQTIRLSPMRARELMRALQSAADRADQLAYQADKARQAQTLHGAELEAAVARVQARLTFCHCKRCRGKFTPEEHRAALAALEVLERAP